MLNPREIFQFKITSHPTSTAPASASASSAAPSSDLEMTYKTQWTLREDCPYLDGHFPNHPLLPAVATIDGSIEFLRQALNQPKLNPQSVFNAKFMAPITPGTKIEMSLVQVVPGKWHVDWTAPAVLPDASQENKGENQNPVQLLARVGLHV